MMMMINIWHEVLTAWTYVDLSTIHPTPVSNTRSSQTQ
ncbi:Uncharacterized protein ChrSV_3354 [Chromobacterium vaccinii]|nr:Uncharacterized protein ChrSW_3354 [Chromobacterium vaccinii]QND90811.1 Uncharacterized protein ChrSV_3354 [Chromobacterium vaccinii]